jgi:uncharacterized damage-inducible protein DinB
MKGYLSSLENTPKTLINIVDQVKPTKYSEYTEPDRFNLTQMVAHLADFEDIFLDRLRLAHESPGATIQTYDAGVRAEEKHYDTRDIHHELEVFDNRRRDLLSFLKELQPDEWQRNFNHPEYGDMTIEEYTNIILAHDLSHISHATTYMR